MELSKDKELYRLLMYMIRQQAMIEIIHGKPEIKGMDMPPSKVYGKSVLDKFK